MNSRYRPEGRGGPPDSPIRASRGFTDYGADDPESSGYGEERAFGDDAYRGEGHGGGYGLAAESDTVGRYGGPLGGPAYRGSRAFGSPSAPDHRGRGPKNYTRPDDRIAEDVNDRLTEDPWVDASHVEVAVAAGEITLTGTIDSRQARRRAEDIAEQVSGVRHVQNNLRVQAAGGPPEDPDEG